MQAQATVQNRFINTITQGDCINVMRQMPADSVDFILTDPPYLVNFRDRMGRTIQNDTNTNWLKPAMPKPIEYSSRTADAVLLRLAEGRYFLEAWREAGFQPVGHLVFRKSYTTKATDFLKYQHEQAYLLAKGRRRDDWRRDFRYDGDAIHRQQAASDAEGCDVSAPHRPAYSLPGDTILDCFAARLHLRGSVADRSQVYRHRTGSEYFTQAVARMERVKERIAAKKRSSHVLIPTAE